MSEMLVTIAVPFMLFVGFAVGAAINACTAARLYKARDRSNLLLFQSASFAFAQLGMAVFYGFVIHVGATRADVTLADRAGWQNMAIGAIALLLLINAAAWYEVVRVEFNGNGAGGG